MTRFVLRRQQDTERIVEEILAADDRELRVGGISEIAVDTLQGTREIAFGVIERLARDYPNRANAAFSHFGGWSFHDFDARNEFHRKIAEVDVAAAAHRKRQRRNAIELDANQ